MLEQGEGGGGWGRSNELQGELTLAFYLRHVDALVNAAADNDKQRLSSLGSPHATTWTLVRTHEDGEQQIEEPGELTWKVSDVCACRRVNTPS